MKKASFTLSVLFGLTFSQTSIAADSQQNVELLSAFDNVPSIAISEQELMETTAGSDDQVNHVFMFDPFIPCSGCDVPFTYGIIHFAPR